MLKARSGAGSLNLSGHLCGQLCSEGTQRSNLRVFSPFVTLVFSSSPQDALPRFWPPCKRRQKGVYLYPEYYPSEHLIDVAQVSKTTLYWPFTEKLLKFNLGTA